MKTSRLVGAFLALAFVAAAFAGDPTGTWKWTVQSPAGEIETTLKLETKDGKLAGAYSNQFGETTISNASVAGDAIAFEVVRDFGGNSFVIKYRGKLSGDTIVGTLEAPDPSGGEAHKLEWNAKREPQAKAAETKPKA